MKCAFIAFICLSLVYSCHPSCDQCNGNVCLHCADPNSEIDQFSRSCRCKQGYYIEYLSPLMCSKVLYGNIVGGCEIDIGQLIQYFQIETTCYYDPRNEGGEERNYVMSEIVINTDRTNFPSERCRQQLKTKLQYQPIIDMNGKDDDSYIDFPSEYIKQDFKQNGDIQIQIPLIDVFRVAILSETNDNQIKQIVNLRVLIGHQRKYLRAHKYQLFVYTNRNQVQTFKIDVDINRSESCQDGQECIIIADLDTAKLVTQSDYQTPVDTNTHLYKVGDIFYAKIYFKDSTYTKQLKFLKLFFKNEENEVYDYTSLTTNQWNSIDHSLHISLKLIEPTTRANIQVNMLIEANRLRRVLSDEGQSIHTQFSIGILSNDLPNNPILNSAHQDIPSQTKSIKIVLNLTTLLLMFLFIW